MTEFRIGCQTITFGAGQVERFPEVFAAVATAGYEGVELGFRHIQPIPAERLKMMLDAHDLALLGAHLGGNLEDPVQAHAERDLLDEVLDYLDVLGAELVIYSGLRGESDGELAGGIDMLCRSARRCCERGIRLLYHNHNWEFAGGARVMNAVLECGERELGLCPDIGWVMKGGRDAVEFLDSAAGRVHAIHFKDFATPGEAVDTVVLGTGVAPLREAADWAKANMTGGWMIAEQDRADISPEEAVAKNARFLTAIFGA